MTNPDRAALLVRELLQTPRDELVRFPQRMGLRTQPTQEELECAHEVLVALVTALESDGGPAWQRMRDAWVGLRQRVTSVAAPLPGPLEPAPPAWLGSLPPKPSLGDAAPGTQAHNEAEQQRARFVPQAPPTFAAVAAFSEPALPMSLSQTPATPPISPLHALLAGNASPAGGATPALPWTQNPSGTSPAAPVVYGESYAVSPRPAGAPGYPPTPTQGSAQAATPPGAPPHRSPPPPPVRTTPAAAPDLSLWTASRYAALCAACSVEPSRALETQREYGITDEPMRRQLDDHFVDRFDRDPVEQELWERLVVQFRERLRPR